MAVDVNCREGLCWYTRTPSWLCVIQESRPVWQFVQQLQIVTGAFRHSHFQAVTHNFTDRHIRTAGMRFGGGNQRFGQNQRVGDINNNCVAVDVVVRLDNGVCAGAFLGMSHKVAV